VRTSRLKALVAVLVVTVAGAAWAGIRDRGVNQFPVAPDFTHQVMPIHFAGWTASGDRVKAHYSTWRKGDSIITHVSARVRNMAGTISAFTANVTKNDLAILTSAIDLYSTGLASEGTYTLGTLIVNPTVIKTGDELGVNFIFAGSDAELAVDDIDIVVEHRPFVGMEY
jgi:hypothetical protein